MNKRILLSLVTAAALIAGAVFATGASAGTYGMHQGMMGGYGMSQGQGMMGSAPAATRTGPAASGPQYYGMGPGMMQGYGYGRYGTRGGYGRYGMGPGMMGGYGMGHGMMGGYGMGHGMMGGYGMGPGMMGGYGMGPGMMGGYGMGHGMMGGYGMGPGMMGGYGMGPGMMGGYGMGHGMMGGYGAYALGLSAEQRRKMAGIWNDSLSKAWPIMGQLREQNFRFAQLMSESNPDRAAVNKVYSRISELRKQLLDQRLDARQKRMEVLTADQRKKLQQGFYHHWQQ